MLLLWIRRIFSTRSAVYASANRLEKACIWLARMLEKKRLVSKEVVSAHPILCISSGFSTAGLPVNRFLLAKQGSGRVAVPGRVHFRGYRASVVILARPHASHFNAFSVAGIGILAAARSSFARTGKPASRRSPLKSFSASSCLSIRIHCRYRTHFRDVMPNLPTAACATACAALRSGFLLFPGSLRTSSS